MADTLSKLKSTFLRHSGTAALVAALSAPALAANEQALSLENTHRPEKVTVVYKRDGRYIPSALEKINHILRDHRRNEVTDINPKTLDRLYHIGQKVKEKYPHINPVFQIISGYRAPKTNALLKNAGGNQATDSQHVKGGAIDFRIKGVSTFDLLKISWCTGSGGTGYYGRDGFIHIDSALNKEGKNRYWQEDKVGQPRGWNTRAYDCSKL